MLRQQLAKTLFQTCLVLMRYTVSTCILLWLETAVRLGYIISRSVTALTVDYEIVPDM